MIRYDNKGFMTVRNLMSIVHKQGRSGMSGAALFDALYDELQYNDQSTNAVIQSASAALVLRASGRSNRR